MLQTGGGLLVLGWVVFTAWGPQQRPPKRASTPKLEPGMTIDVAITLVATDAKALACASTEVVAGRHCAFEAKGTPWSRAEDRPDAEAVLAPYKTTDDQLLLIPGLFAQPALQERLRYDPPVVGMEHLRFVAHCKLAVEGKMSKLEARWAMPPKGEWFPLTNAWTGTVSDCKVSDG